MYFVQNNIVTYDACPFDLTATYIGIKKPYYKRVNLCVVVDFDLVD